MTGIVYQLKKSKRVLVASHVNPDGDAIGSLLAMGLSLEALDKQTTWYNESIIPAVYRFLPGVERVESRLSPENSFDAAVILDCGDLQRTGDAAPAIGRIPLIVNIDHHVTNSRFGDLHLIDTEACATAEIVYRLIREMGVPITREIAASLYTGILTDTGSFRFSNTNRPAFAICAEMMALGVDPYEIAQHVFGTYSLGRIKLLNRALDSIEISPNGMLSLMALTEDMFRETGTQPEDIDGFINYAKRIEAVKVAVLIHETNNGKRPSPARSRFHVSLRSDGSIDVAAIATAFGGGGHSSAAGFCRETTMADLREQIFRLSERL